MKFSDLMEEMRSCLEKPIPALPTAFALRSAIANIWNDHMDREEWGYYTVGKDGRLRHRDKSGRFFSKTTSPDRAQRTLRP